MHWNSVGGVYKIPSANLLDSVDIVSLISADPLRDTIKSLIFEGLAAQETDFAGGSRAAEVLHELGYEVEARTILFGLAEKMFSSPFVEPWDTLWLANAMICSDLSWSARRVLAVIDHNLLDEDSAARYQQLQQTIALHLRRRN